MEKITNKGNKLRDNCLYVSYGKKREEGYKQMVRSIIQKRLKPKVLLIAKVVVSKTSRLWVRAPTSNNQIIDCAHKQLYHFTLAKLKKKTTTNWCALL